MSFPENLLLRRAVRFVMQAIRPSGVVLLYHRIGDGCDPFRNAVTEEHFASHLEVIRKYAVPLPLSKLVENFASERPIRSAVAVSFDDGYASTLELALPLLERHQIPATAFLVSDAIGQDQEFWWDQLELILSDPQSDPTELHRYHAKLMRANHDDKAAILTGLWAAGGRKPAARLSHLPLNLSQLQKLAQSSLIEIGAHTRTHPVLTNLDQTSKSAEIAESLRTIERMTQITPAAFSYPHGIYDQETLDQVRTSGFRYACCSKQQSIRSLDCCYRVPRFAVPDWDAKTFSSKLEGWLASPAARSTV